jgi:hypothetical protein
MSDDELFPKDEPQSSPAGISRDPVKDADKEIKKVTQEEVDVDDLVRDALTSTNPADES